MTDDPLIDVLSRIATHLKYLGNGNAATTMGAIEGLAVKQYEAAQLVAQALDNVADAIRETHGSSEDE